jgi:putative ABC transport system permease protein
LFSQPGRLTAIAIRLRDPARLREASERLQAIPGAQVVTLTEMMGTFLNLVGAVRTLLTAIAIVALAVGVISVFNTLLAAVIERTNELCILRALGASRLQIVQMITTEALLLTGVGSVVGVALASIAGRGMENVVKQFVPLAPHDPIFSMSAIVLLQSVLIGGAVGVVAGWYPAWRASRLQPASALKGET